MMLVLIYAFCAGCGRLRAGGGDVRGDWQAQLEADAALLLAAGVPVWLRADAAYYCEEFVEYRRSGAGTIRRA